MDEEYSRAYQMITQGIVPYLYDYTTPEEEGAAIEKCSILQATNIEYSNETTIAI